MKNKLSVIAVAAIMAVTAAGCAGGCATDSGHRHAQEIDAEAYSLGETHGKAVVDCASDSAALCEHLLDVRTRESDFRHRFGANTADSYVAGFEAYVRANSPSLAAELF